MTHTVHQVPLLHVTIAPALACIPMMSQVAERFLSSPKPELKKIGAELKAEHTALNTSLDDLGILEPIKAYREGARWVAVDGRHRIEWQTKTDPSGEVPLILISKEDADKIIEASVIGRRHWTKGQRAWLGVMQHPEVCEAGEGRPKNSDSVGVSLNYTTLADRIGVSPDVVNQAGQLYRLFFAPGAKVGSPAAIEAAALKAKYEHLIWGGAGLGGVLAGIAGGEATGDKPKAQTGFHHLDAPLASLGRLGKVWGKWNPEEQAKAQALIVARVRGTKEAPGWPEEFRTALAEALAAAD